MVCTFTAATVSPASEVRIDHRRAGHLASGLLYLLDSSLLTHHFLGLGFFGLSFFLPWSHAQVQIRLSIPGTDSAFRKRGPRNGFLAGCQDFNLHCLSWWFLPPGCWLEAPAAGVGSLKKLPCKRVIQS